MQSFMCPSLEMSRELLMQASSAPASSVMCFAGAAPPQSESPLAKFLIGGGVAWTYELCIGHFLEFLKITKQTNAGLSYLECTKQITAKKGLIGVLDGFFPWGTVQAIAKGAVFSWGHAFARSNMQPLVDNGTMNAMVAEVLAGGIGGGFQGIVLSPTLLLKTRVMTDPIFRENMTLSKTTKESLRVGMRVIRVEGIAALMKGATVFSMKRVADWSTRYLFSEMIEHQMKGGDPNTQLSTVQKLSASMLGGSISGLFTIPLDVMVAQIQQASKAGQSVSVLDTFKAEYKQGGMQQIAGFATRGFVSRLLHVALTTAIMKTGTSFCYDLYLAR